MLGDLSLKNQLHFSIVLFLLSFVLSFVCFHRRCLTLLRLKVLVYCGHVYFGCLLEAFGQLMCYCQFLQYFVYLTFSGCQYYFAYGGYLRRLAFPQDYSNSVVSVIGLIGLNFKQVNFLLFLSCRCLQFISSFFLKIVLISSLSSFSSLLFNFFCVSLISSDTISIVFSQNVNTSDMYQGGSGP